MEFISVEHFKSNATGFSREDEVIATKLYEDFGKKDPFPSIPSALLNSSDIFKYVKKTGMICPFYPNKLKGATYQVSIGNECTCWDNDGQKLTYNDGFTIKKNSIVYVELEPNFRVPDYIILRFNLKIKHIYKGLLLGTGPIVDPGFKGKLYIPLHNLTNNDYIFKKGDTLIEMEFTKLSPNKSWIDKDNIDEYGEEGIFIPFPENRLDGGIGRYIDNALEGYIKKNEDSSITKVINNAIPVELQAIKKITTEIDKRYKYSMGFIIATIISVIVGFGSIVVSFHGTISSSNTRYDNLVKEFEEYKQKLEYSLPADKNYNENNIDYKIEELQKEIELLKLQKEIELLKEDLDSEQIKTELG